MTNPPPIRPDIFEDWDSETPPNISDDDSMRALFGFSCGVVIFIIILHVVFFVAKKDADESPKKAECVEAIPIE